MEPLRGLEPRTYALQVRCSTTELKRLVAKDYKLYKPATISLSDERISAKMRFPALWMIALLRSLLTMFAKSFGRQAASSLPTEAPSERSE